jgi:protein-L-isoaspartate(D-aspartate) O-methyltransferase
MPDTHTQSLVEILRGKGELADPRVEAAFLAVPRHRFIPDVNPEETSVDKDIPLLVDTTGEVIYSCAQPSTIAYVLRSLDLREGHNVLEVGAGTGYTAALIRRLIGEGGSITALEIDPLMVERAQDNLLAARIGGVHVVHTDGAGGYAPRAAYDRIVSMVGVWDVPSAWARQLKRDGLMVVPVWLDSIQFTATFRQQPDGTLLSVHNMPSAFVYMRGDKAGPRVRLRVGSTGLTLLCNEAQSLDAASLAALLSADHEHCQLSMALASTDYWYGFLPYVMLREPADSIFALYYVLQGRSAFGIDGTGFAYFMPGSACFVPYWGLGYTHCFAGADAFLSVETFLHEWDQAGRPGIDSLRIRLIPKSHPRPINAPGKIYDRREHYLHVWQE